MRFYPDIRTPAIVGKKEFSGYSESKKGVPVDTGKPERFF
jgi:hypothetical protein